jgi:hypothetical protein
MPAFSSHAIPAGWRAITPAVAMPIRAPRAKPTVAALCVSGRSIYHHMAGVVAYDSRRDARTFPGGMPVVAHPPCRTWSKFLRHQARPADYEGERDLARFCVRMVLENGGVLEQPAGSLLWEDQNLPMPNRSMQDPFLYTIYLEQSWFGYASRKPTWVLVSGVPKHLVPPMPILLVNGAKGQALRMDNSAGSQAARSRTMLELANWLCQTARLTWWQHAKPAAAAW